MKTVIITGTSSGIGLDLVKIFDSNGYRVISLSRNDEMSFKFVSNNESSIDVPNKSLKNLSLMRVRHKLTTDFLIASSFFSTVTSFVTGCRVNDKLMSLNAREIWTAIHFDIFFPNISIRVF